MAAGFLQLASPFVFAGTLLLGLATEIPVSGDPHGYVQIFGFVLSLVLLIPGVVLPGIAIPLLRRSRRGGAILLVVTAGLWLLLFLGLASGMPGGIAELEWSRVVTIAVGMLGAAAASWSVWAGVTAYSRFLPR